MALALSLVPDGVPSWHGCPHGTGCEHGCELHSCATSYVLQLYLKLLHIKVDATMLCAIAARIMRGSVGIDTT